jgi:uncharacterized BrkB/YihY/UPF0761 family membrane protein
VSGPNRSGQEELSRVPVERIEESSEFERLHLTAVEPSKAATARLLALILIWTFAVVLLISLGIGCYVLNRSTAIDDKVLAGSLEFVKATSSIFTPLLAFVLGYYFSKREE